MKTSRYQGLFFFTLIIIFGNIDLAVPVDEKQINLKEATNSAVPVDEEQTDENAATISLTSPENKAKTDALQKIKEAPKGKVSSTAKKTTKDPINRLFYTSHQFLWFLERLWERVKYGVKRTMYNLRMRRYSYYQYPPYAPGYGR